MNLEQKSMIMTFTESFLPVLLFLVLNVSLVSSLQGVPFSTNVGGLTIYRCNATSR